MKNSKTLILIFTLFFSFNLYAQNDIELKGYVNAENNAGFIENGDVYIYQDDTLNLINHIKTDEYGTFSTILNSKNKYFIKIQKDIYFDEFREIDFKKANENNKLFLKIEMKRKPGYIFEINLTEVKTNPEAPVDGIVGALVEVYNNTTDKEVSSFINNRPNFNIYLNKGNHYTILIRKKGYLAKKLEAYLNINGCIICFDGVSKMKPGVRSRLNKDKSIGAYLADIEMEKVFEGKKIKVNNIYYERNKWNITEESKKELNKLSKILKLNPNLIVELGSHTDSRGSAAYNLELSDKRAKAAVDYLVKEKHIPAKRISYRGYGETELVNLCKDGITCSEKQHAQNRRTEIKIMDIINDESEENFIPLKIIKNEEKLEKKLQDILNSKSKIVKYRAGELPNEVKEDVYNKTIKDSSNLHQNIQKDNKVNTKSGSSSKSNNEIIKKSNTDKTTDIPKDDIIYKIALVFTKYPLPKDHILYKNIPDVEEYIDKEGGYVLYLVGNYKTREKAKKALNNKWKKTYKKAYIVKFKNKTKVDN